MENIALSMKYLLSYYDEAIFAIFVCSITTRAQRVFSNRSKLLKKSSEIPNSLPTNFERYRSSTINRSIQSILFILLRDKGMKNLRDGINVNKQDPLN